MQIDLEQMVCFGTKQIQVLRHCKRRENKHVGHEKLIQGEVQCRMNQKLPA